MLAYILKRILLMLPTLLGVLLLTFVVIQFVPGGPVEQYMAEAKAGAGAGGGAIRSSASAIRARSGFGSDIGFLLFQFALAFDAPHKLDRDPVKTVDIFPKNFFIEYRTKIKLAITFQFFICYLYKSILYL